MAITSLSLSLLPLGVAHAEPGPALARSCVDVAPRVCAPGNVRGVPAGCYDDGGVLEFAWPCTPWLPRYGYSHPDGTVTYSNGDVWDGTDITPPAAVTLVRCVRLPFHRHCLI